jgi:dimethylargininase
VRIAITRGISPNLEHCELSHLERRSIDLDLARTQHREYEDCLAAFGCFIHRLPAEPELPDCVFVEDTCVVLDELAIAARMGAESRRLESQSVAEILKSYREVRHIEPPGTLDGGDVLQLGRAIFVGLSARTNRAGIDQLRALVAPYDYSVHAVVVRGCLHLKSAITQVAPETLLVNRDWVNAEMFRQFKLIDMHPSKPMAANVLLIGNQVLYPVGYPRTRERLEDHGIRVRTVDVSELAKAEGGVTCCSVVFNDRATDQR